MDASYALQDAFARLETASDPRAIVNRARDRDADLDAVAKEFESVLVGQMVQAMFAGLETDGPFSGGHGETMMRSMLTDEYAKAMVEEGGLGLADHIKRELIALQEAP